PRWFSIRDTEKASRPIGEMDNLMGIVNQCGWRAGSLQKTPEEFSCAVDGAVCRRGGYRGQRRPGRRGIPAQRPTRCGVTRTKCKCGRPRYGQRDLSRHGTPHVQAVLFVRLTEEWSGIIGGLRRPEHQPPFGTQPEVEGFEDTLLRLPVQID